QPFIRRFFQAEEGRYNGCGGTWAEGGRDRGWRLVHGAGPAAPGRADPGLVAPARGDRDLAATAVADCDRPGHELWDLHGALCVIPVEGAQRLAGCGQHDQGPTVILPDAAGDLAVALCVQRPGRVAADTLDGRPLAGGLVGCDRGCAGLAGTDRGV